MQIKFILLLVLIQEFLSFSKATNFKDYYE